MGIWVHHYAVIRVQVVVIFRENGVWPSLYDVVVVSWLRLQTPIGGGNHNNNDGKGHELSRCNCCNDSGCMKVNQHCKFEMKTNLKLACKEDLHAVSNQGLTLRIRAYN